MTAFIATKDGETITLFGDTAMLVPDGTFAVSKSKFSILELGDGVVVIAQQGPAIANHLFTKLETEGRSFTGLDDFYRRFAFELERFQASSSPMVTSDGYYRCIVASQGGCSRLGLVYGPAACPPGHRPFIIYDALDKVFWGPANPIKGDDVDVFEAWRFVPFETVYGPIFGIGDTLEELTLHAGAVRRRVVREWPDTQMRKIDPHATVRAASTSTWLHSTDGLLGIMAGRPVAVQFDIDATMAANSDDKFPSQRAVKSYVDTARAFARVRAVSTSNITISTALNNGDSLDGVTLATGDEVLLPAQTAPAENGVYVVGASPARATAFSTYDSMPGVGIRVMEGTVNADTTWFCNSNKGGTLGSTALVFAEGVSESRQPPRLLRHSNVLPHGTFAQGSQGFAGPSNSLNALAILSIDSDTSGTMETYFARAKMQLSAEATSRTQYIGPSRPIRVDPTQKHSLGAVLTCYSGPITADIRVKCYNESMAVVGTLNISATVPTGPSASATSNYFWGCINEVGGSAPAWPAGTVAAIPQAGYVSTAVQGLNVWAIWCIPQSEFPGNVSTLTAQPNFGFGTHEAVADSSNLYVLNHSFNLLVKFDANMQYVSNIAIGDYPHDIVSIGNKLWVTNQDDTNVRRVDKATFAVDATYSITGSRSGFGLATDGTRLWVGAGTTAQTPGIYEVNTTTGTMTLLSTDVDGGTANVPVRYLDGSVWSIKQTPSEVKRINPTGGATIATISAAIGGIYGLGSGEGYVFANGRLGVAQIDVATNTVVKRYWYRETAIGHSNIEVHDGRAYACSSTGVMIIDIASQTSEEIVLDSGNNKWARALPGGDVVIGSYAAPWLFVLGSN
jgi:hypothetical protein